MKVIAKVDNDRVLCEVSNEEIALLNGFRHQYDEGCRIQELRDVGSECDLTKMANTSRYVRNLNRESLEVSKKKLEDSILVLDEAMKEITKLTIFETLKDSD